MKKAVADLKAQRFLNTIHKIAVLSISLAAPY